MVGEPRLKVRVREPYIVLSPLARCDRGLVHNALCEALVVECALECVPGFVSVLYIYIYIICCTSADRVLNSRTRGLRNKMASHPYIYIVCVRRANSELLRWSRHFNDVLFFGLLQISVTGLKILRIKNVHDLVLIRLKKFEYNQNNNKIKV